MSNSKVRIKIIESGLKQYEVAELMGMNETAFSMKLRNELPEAEQKAIIKKIEEVKK